MRLHDIHWKFGTSKCAKTPLTARRPKTKVPLVEAPIVFFAPPIAHSTVVVRWLGIGAGVAASEPREAMSTQSNDLGVTV